MADTEFQPLDRDGIAARVARDIPEGWFVNLGIGIPTKVSDFVQDREVTNTPTSYSTLCGVTNVLMMEVCSDPVRATL
jgi:acyl CoA:acetate/3-ketoacid CoA transferase beta subunit